MQSGDEIPQPLQNIGCQDLLKTDVQYCGWLRKRHFLYKLNIFNWPQVYTVLAKGCIYYFKDEYSKSTLGKFSLYGYNYVKRSMKITPKQCIWAFEIAHTHTEEFRTYYFATGSEQEMKEWMKHVKAMLVEANKKQASDYYTYKKAFDKDKDLESVTYQEIEMKIYDDSSNFLVSKDYKARFQIKGKDEESDEDDPPPLPKARTIDRNRPAQPLPTDQARPTSNAPAIPPRRQGDTLPHTSGKKTLTKQNTDPGSGADKKHRNQEKRRGSDETSNRPKKDERLQRRALPDLPKDENEEEDEDAEDEEDGEDGGYWKAIHFNSSNGEKASEIIKRLSKEGTFLVRDGSNGGKVLVVHVASNAKKYEIKNEDDRYFLKKGGPYGESLEDLLYKHHSVDLPTCKTKLTLPFRLHPNFDKSMIS